MTLVDLIEYLIKPKKFKKLKLQQDEIESLIIYLKDALSVDSDVEIFDVEETEDNITYEKNGTRYIQLFPVEMAIDLIKSDLELLGKGYSDLQIANRLLEYRIKDA